MNQPKDETASPEKSSSLSRRYLTLYLACLLPVCLAFSFGLHQFQTYQNDAQFVLTAQQLAQTALAGDEPDEGEILLKINDLVSLDGVLGVRLTQGGSTPLSVGEVSAQLPLRDHKTLFHQWSKDGRSLDIALPIRERSSFDWLILRLDRGALSAGGSLALPLYLFAPIVFLILFWAVGYFALRRVVVAPLQKLSSYLLDPKNQQGASPLPPPLSEQQDEIGTLGFATEQMRATLVAAKIKVEAQANMLSEIPEPILRCSINRKILYANPAAKQHAVFFDGDKFDVVSAGLTDLIRRAFQEAKPVTTTLQHNKVSFVCHAFPVLDKGYVNLTALQKSNDKT